jgi:hypothetical protein
MICQITKMDPLDVLGKDIIGHILAFCGDAGQVLNLCTVSKRWLAEVRRWASHQRCVGYTGTVESLVRCPWSQAQELKLSMLPSPDQDDDQEEEMLSTSFSCLPSPPVSPRDNLASLTKLVLFSRDLKNDVHESAISLALAASPQLRWLEVDHFLQGSDIRGHLLAAFAKFPVRMKQLEVIIA